MGMNNLIYFLKNSNFNIEEIKHAPNEYHLFIDLSIIIVPIMQLSETVEDFKEHLKEIFLNNNNLINLIIKAKTIYASLDMLSPKMKKDTYKMRFLKRFNENKYKNEQNWNRKNFKKDDSIDLLEQKNKGNLKKNINDIILLNKMIKQRNTVQLKYIRSSLEKLILDILKIYDNSIEKKITIETDLIGEGEIKCMKKALTYIDKNNFPIVFLSNDNDILLMILMHEPTNILDKINFYRAILKTHKNEKIEIRYQHVKYKTENIWKNLDSENNWKIILWIICCCGTDYVQNISSITTERKIEIFHYCMNNNESEKRGKTLNMCTFIQELKNFISITKKIGYFKNNENTKEEENDETIKKIISNKKINKKYQEYISKKIINWLIRLYWNILYIKELPANFYNNPNFISDKNMPINIYTPNENINIFSLNNFLKRKRQEVEKDIRKTVYSIK